MKNVFVIIGIILLVVIGYLVIKNSVNSGNIIFDEAINGNIANTKENENVLTFNIASEKTDCVGSIPMKCLVVNGEYFYDSIEGFVFEDGHKYELLVERKERKNVPADANKYTYTLIKEVNKTAASPLRSNGWYWKETKYDNGELVTANVPSDFLFTFMNGGTFSVTTDCNNGTGNYEEGFKSLKFGAITSTKKACSTETQETEFFEMLEEVDSYTITKDDDLSLHLESASKTMIFMPAR